MNAAKMTLVSTVVAAFGLALGFIGAPGDSYACNEGFKHKSGEPCGGGDKTSGGGPFTVKVTFDDLDGDIIKSDCGDRTCPYIGGVDGVVAHIPVDGPPGQFVLTLFGNKGTDRRFSIDLGESCSINGDGVLDGVAAVGSCVECPFGVGEGGRCAGKARGNLTARDPIEIVGGGVIDLGYILTMDPGPGPLTRGQNHEVEFRVGKKFWRIDFDDVTCNVETPDAGDFLDIVASDVSPGAGGLDDPDFLEKWVISTGGGSKRGCLSKSRGAKTTPPIIGNFELSLGYTVCILADPEMNNDCILE